MNPRIRAMTGADLDSVLRIEARSFFSPWSRAAFEAELARPGGLSLVFDEDGEVAGFIVAWRVLDELHVADLAVRPDRRRRGVAQALLHQLRTAETGVSWIGLEVRASNVPARALYRKLGFSESGLRKGYYADTGEDAVLMAITVPFES